MADPSSEGWGYPAAAKKAHYFAGLTALCGKWMFSGELEPDNGASTDDCVACRRKLAKRTEGK